MLNVLYINKQGKKGKNMTKMIGKNLKGKEFK